MNHFLLYLNVPAAVGDEVSEWLLLETEGFTSFLVRGHSKKREQVAGFEARLLFMIETEAPQALMTNFRKAFRCDHRAWVVALEQPGEI